MGCVWCSSRKNSKGLIKVLNMSNLSSCEEFSSFTRDNDSHTKKKLGTAEQKHSNSTSNSKFHNNLTPDHLDKNIAVKIVMVTFLVDLLIQSDT